MSAEFRQRCIEAMQTEERRVAGLLAGVPVHPLQRYEWLYDAVLTAISDAGYAVLPKEYEAKARAFDELSTVIAEFRRWYPEDVFPSASDGGWK